MTAQRQQIKFKSSNPTSSDATLWSWPLDLHTCSQRGAPTLLITCVHVCGSKEDEWKRRVKTSAPSPLFKSLSATHDYVPLLIVIHELSPPGVWGCFIATRPFWLQWVGDEAVVARSQVHGVICPSVISMEWNGFSSRALFPPSQ